jgi:hypothetical protein
MNPSHQSSAATTDTRKADHCFVCDKSLTDGQWFCRLPEDFNIADTSQRKVLLCSSYCAFLYFASLDIGISQI